MDSTDGLRRGLEVIPTGGPIKMPVGSQIKGRMMNVVGEPIDGMKELEREGAYPIHREPPKFEDLSTVQEVLTTGIRLSTCWSHMPRVVRSDSLEVPEWVRLCSFRNS